MGNSNISLKTENQIKAMREGGKILGIILEEIQNKTKKGVSTKELDLFSEKLFQKFNVIPSFRGYQGYPANICTSINEEVVHTIPSDRKLKNGDIISIDAGVLHKGLHTDSAITVSIGNITNETKKFISTAEEALRKSLNLIKPGIKLGEISNIIQKTAQENGYSIVKELTGHGIGKNLHEAPNIPNYGKKTNGPILKEGMTLAIEPIFSQKKSEIITLSDNWTIVTKDKSLSCQVEHTILITKNSCEILTIRPSESPL